MKPKRPRMVRTPSTAFSPTARDLEVLTLVGLCRYLSTEQIARDCFPSSDRARRRIRRLFDAGYLDVRFTTSTAPNIISLTRRGLEVLQGEFPDLATRLHTSGAIRLNEVERHLATVDARLYAAALGNALAAPLVCWSARKEGPPEDLLLPDGLEPDAIAEFDAESPRRYVAVEVAVTPEALRAVAARLDAYLLVPGLLVVWVVVRDGGVQTVARRAGERVVVLERPHLVARPVRALPGMGGRRAEGPAAPESSSAQARGELRRFNTEGRR